MNTTCHKSIAWALSLMAAAALTAIGCTKAEPEPQPEPDPVFETDLTFECSFTEVTDTSVSAEVKPSANSEYYYYTLVAQDQFEGDTATIKSILSGFTDIAVADGVTLADVIRSKARKGISSETFTGLDILEPYYLFVFQLNPEGAFGNAATFEVTTDTDMDKFDFEFEVTDIICWDAYVSVKPTDKYSKYIMDVLPCEQVDSFDDETAFIKSNIKKWGSYLPLVNRKGDAEGDYSTLYPDSDYYVVAYGYDLDRDKITTSLRKYKFSTNPVSYLQNFSIEVKPLSLTCVNGSVIFKPTADNVDNSVKMKFFSGIIPDANIEGDLKETLQSVIDLTIEDMLNRFPSYSREDLVNGILSKGNAVQRSNHMTPETDYTGAAVLIDKDGLIVSGPWSAGFTTPAYTLSECVTDAEMPAYYDGDEVVKLQTNALYVGNIIVKMVLTEKSQDTKNCYMAMVRGDYSDAAEYPDTEVIPSILDASPSGIQPDKPIYMYTPWSANPEDGVWTMLSVGQDADGNWSKVSRRVYTITRDGANPPEEFINRNNAQDNEPAAMKEWRYPAL